MKVKKTNEKLYSYNLLGYCGLFLPETVMKKIVKIICKAQDDIKRVLYQDKDILKTYNWTMATKEDEKGQITKVRQVDYILSKDTKKEIEDRINYIGYIKPEFRKEVFIVSSHEEAKEIAKMLLESEGV
jgi:hypothetical protein